MAFETLVPQALESDDQNNNENAGSDITDLQSPVDAPDGNFFGPDGATDVYFTTSFNAPSNSLTGTQKFRGVFAKTSSGGNDPQIRFRVYENGTDPIIGPTFTITSLTGQVVEWDWSPSGLIVDQTGQSGLVRCGVRMLASGGNPNTRRGVKCDAIEWVAQIDGAPSQNLTASGVASGEAVGTAAVTAGSVTLEPAAVSSGEQLGTAAVVPASMTIGPTSISSGEAVGTPSVTSAPVTLGVFGVASGEAFGTAAVTAGSVTLEAAAISSGEAVGTAAVAAGSVTLEAAAISSGEAVGTAAVTAGSVTLEPVGVASSELFGTPSAGTNSVTLEAAAVSSIEAFGLGEVTQRPPSQFLSPSAVLTAEAHGTAAITVTAVTLEPVGVASGEQLGTPALVADGVIVTVGSIDSIEAFGTPAVTVGPTSIEPVGLASSEAFGTAAVAAGSVTLEAAAISSGEAVGTPSAGIAQTLEPPGVDDGGAFGSAVATTGPVTIAPSAIAPSHGVGSPAVAVGFVTISAAGISSGEQFGTPAALAEQFLNPPGLNSGEQLGTPTAQIGSVTIEGAGIGTVEAVGTPAVTVGPVVIAATGIGSGELFGLPRTGASQELEQLGGIGTLEAFGLPAVTVTGVTIEAAGISSAEQVGTNGTIDVYSTAFAVGGELPAGGMSITGAALLNDELAIAPPGHEVVIGDEFGDFWQTQLASAEDTTGGDWRFSGPMNSVFGTIMLTAVAGSPVLHKLTSVDTGDTHFAAASWFDEAISDAAVAELFAAGSGGGIPSRVVAPSYARPRRFTDQNLRIDGSTVLHAVDGSKVLAAGIIYGGKLSPAASRLDLSGSGLGAYFNRRTIRQDLIQTGDLLDLARAVIEAAQAEDGGDIGVDTSATNTVGITTKLEVFGFERKTVGEVLRQLASIDAGFDYWFEPVLDKASNTFVVKFAADHPTIGRNSGVVLADGANCTVTGIDIIGTEVANLIDVIGSGDGTVQTIATVSESPVGNRPLMELAISESGESSSSVLSAMASQRLARSRNPIYAVQVEMMPGASPRIGQYRIGDVVRLVGDFHYLQLDGLFRITARQVALGASEPVASLTLAQLEAFEL